MTSLQKFRLATGIILAILGVYAYALQTDVDLMKSVMVAIFIWFLTLFIGE